MLWNTRYLDAAVARLREQGHDIRAEDVAELHQEGAETAERDVAELGRGGHEVREEDMARLSPLKHKHLNVLGKYAFTASQPAGGLRPLRDADGGFDPDDE